MIRKGFVFSILLVTGMTISSPISTQIAFQGILTDGNGIPYKDSTGYKVNFTLYSDSVTDSEVWSEDQIVSTKKGLFSAALGSVKALDTMKFDQQYWLGVKRDNGGQIGKRIKLGVMPYSKRAMSADTANYARVAGSALSVNGANIVAGMRLDSLRVSGTITADSLAVTKNITAGSSIIGTNPTGISIKTNTSDGSDTKYAGICGGGSISSNGRGAGIVTYGNEHLSKPGMLEMWAGSGNGTTTGAIWASPRMYFGASPSTDAYQFKADSVTSPILQGNVVTRGTHTADSLAITKGISVGNNITGVNTSGLVILPNTADGNDSRYVLIAGGGGSVSTTRGGYVALYGNENASDPGRVMIRAGNGAIAGAFNVYTKNIERFIIDTVGNVGIGISAPTNKLHVNGDARVGGRLLVTSMYNSKTWQLGDYGGITNGNFHFSVGAKAPMVLDTTGYVGIGKTTGITAPLDVRGLTKSDSATIPILTGNVATRGTHTATVLNIGTGDAMAGRFYIDTTFTITLAGFTSTVTATAKAIKIGRQVTLSISPFEGISNTSLIDFTLPATIRPSAATMTTTGLMRIPLSATIYTVGLYIEGNGIASFTSSDLPAGWPNSGVKGISIASVVFTYVLN